MSQESTLSNATDAIEDAVTDSLETEDIASMLDTEATAESIGRDIGRRVGREAGAIVGRELGGSVAVDIRERKGLRTILANVRDRVVELLTALLRNVDIEPAVSRLIDASKSLLSDRSAGDLLGSVAPDMERDDDGDESTAADDDQPDPDDTDPSELSADQLQEMREETYREFLEEMSYRDLQSIAKEIDVKANLSRDEMTEQITDKFSSGSESE